MLNKIFLICVMLAVCVCASGKHYIDFSSGSDANTGTTKLSPWKRYGGMLNSTGLSNSFNHINNVADTFVFKGGVTWDSSCFPMTVDTQNTYSGANYVFTVDSTWYSGSSFSRPTFNAMKKTFPASAGVIRCKYKGVVTFNCFELRNYKAVPGSGDGDPVGFNCYSDTNLCFTNNLIDSIYPDHSDPVDNNNAPFMFNACSTVVVNNNIVAGRDSGGLGVCVTGTYGNHYTVSSNTIHDIGGGVYFGCTVNNNIVINNNNIYQIIQGGLSPAEHTNGIFVYGPGYGSIYSNQIHNSTTPEGIWENGGQWKVYNNVFYSNTNNASLAWEVPTGSNCPTCSLWLWNNYSEYNFRYVPNTASNTGYMQIENNILGSVSGVNLNLATDTVKHLFIDYNVYTGFDSTSNPTYLDTINHIYTPTQARVAGFDAHSYWSVNPHVDTDGTIHNNFLGLSRGDNLSSKFSTDITGATRTNWSIGAYDNFSSIDSIAYLLDSVGIDTMRLGTAVFQSTYTIDIPIRCNYAIFLNTTVSTISKPIIVRDSIVYTSGATITSLFGSGIYSTVGHSLVIKLNGVLYTPPIHNISTIKFK